MCKHPPEEYLPMGFQKEREYWRKYELWPWFHLNPDTTNEDFIEDGPPVPGVLKKYLTLPKEPESEETL
ncbi:MAG: hypothetical protein GF375_04365 [Candidatus Omnitrophica bacterium]|nr:hypothetical protein [Candidatus Omnitrophota bacterium]